MQADQVVDLAGGTRMMLHSGGMTELCLDAMQRFLGDEALLIPYAGYDLDAYTARIQERIAPKGIRLRSIHREADPERAVMEAPALFMGGGNSFRLLKTLYAMDLLRQIRRRVEAGMPYLGSSAGSNVACPTIRTTNDMPIVMPPSFDALGLTPFQINPHYVDPAPVGTQVGETREQRLWEFLQENDVVVVGLREESWLIIENGRIRLEGPGGAMVFRRVDGMREYERESRSGWAQAITPDSDLSGLFTLPQFDRRG